LVEEVRTEAGLPGDFVAKVDVPGFFELLHFDFRRDLVEHRFERIAFQRRVINAAQLAADAQNGRTARGHVQVGGLLLHHQVEEGVDLGHKWGSCLCYDVS